MEELIERVSAISDSPILGYTWHKTYRQVSLFCLVFLLTICSTSFCEESKPSSKQEFKPYTSNSKSKIPIKDNPYAYSENGIKEIELASEAMNEVDELFNKVSTSIDEILQIWPSSQEDENKIKRTLAELDGMLSYVNKKLHYSGNQIKAAVPVTTEEIKQCEDLRVRIHNALELTLELKNKIAKRLAINSKKGKK